MHVIKPTAADGWHIETLRGVAQCGETLNIDSESVLREEYQPSSVADTDARHGCLCTECHLLLIGKGQLIDD